LFKKFLYAFITPISNLRWKQKFWKIPLDLRIYRSYIHLKNRKRTKLAEKLIKTVKESIINQKKKEDF
jgi:hypothetical protein